MSTRVVSKLVDAGRVDVPKERLTDGILPSAVNPGDKAIEDLGSRIRERDGDGPWNPIEAVLSRGGIIMKTMVTKDLAGAPLLIANSPKDFIVFRPYREDLSPIGGFHEQWWTAVALAHLTLHYPKFSLTGKTPLLAVPLQIAAESSLYEARSEANKLAAAFLMPWRLFSPCWATTGLSESATMAIMGLDIPTGIATARAQALGLHV